MKFLLKNTSYLLGKILKKYLKQSNIHIEQNIRNKLIEIECSIYRF